MLRVRLHHHVLLSRAVAWCGLMAFVGTAFLTRADVVISEFLASNKGGLADGYQDTPDWIELHNTGTVPVNLAGWFLSDDPADPKKWTLPSETVGANGFLVVFASGRNTQDPAGYWHTNFQLDADGETVLLVQPDGVTVASRLNSPARPQAANVSFGLSGAAGVVTLLKDDAPLRAWVPVDGVLGSDWTKPDFEDSTWLAGGSPVGFEDTPENYAALIQTDLGTAMRGRSTTCFIRYAFTVDDPALLGDWRMRVQYDDGFAAWLNGEPVGSRNAPVPLDWNSAATQNHPDNEALVPDELSIPSEIIRTGRNVLALQGLNVGLTSSDFLLRATVVARPQSAEDVAAGYLVTPTPGGPNSEGVGALGPLIEEAKHSPLVPTATDSLRVRVRVRPALAAVASVQLTYTVQFGSEVTMPMLDDGKQGDGPAADGVFGALIPAAPAGQMIRYYITAEDITGATSRVPLNHNPFDSERYRGTVVADPNVTSKLPVVQLFVPPAELPRIDGETGGRGVVFYDGELYDNVLLEVRGNTTAGCNKKSHRVEFPRDHEFRHWGPGGRIRKTSFMADYADPSYLRQHLSFWLATQAGLAAPFYDPVRLQLNGQFYQLAYHSDVMGEEQLKRFDLDPDGALYKACGVVIPDGSSTGGFQKQTREWEGTQDYVAFANSIRPGLGVAQRRTNLFDRVDLPHVINYMAVARIVQEEDDVWANMTLYRDTEGDQEWRIIPFDMNLSWGQIYGSGTVQATIDSFKSNPLYGNSRCIQAGGPFDAYNRFYDAIIQVPETRQMLLRRMRTLMDRFVQPPGTPADQLILEQHIQVLTNSFWTEAFLDRQKWGWPVGCGPYGFGANLWLTNGVNALENQFIVPRRRHLFATHSITNAAKVLGLANSNKAGIPLAQPADAVLQFGEIEFNPASHNQGEEYIQLINTNDFAVDMSDWRVSGAVEYVLVPGTVLPAGSVLYLSPSVAEFRARSTGPRGGQAAFVHGPYQGQLSARGESLTLTDATGREVASMTYPGHPSPAQEALRITEIHYHPAPLPGNPLEDEEFEFIELGNIGLEPIHLTGVRFTNGIAADLTSVVGGPLGPGEALVLARNPEAFRSRYGPGPRLFGTYLGRLDNAGERLRLVDAVGEEIADFSFQAEWASVTDGGGPSLELAGPDLPPGERASWRASTVIGGTPGTGGTAGPKIHRVAVGANDLQLVFVAEEGVAYAVQVRATLANAPWDVAQLIPPAAINGPQSLTVPLEGSGPRFFRIVTR